jgi:receptor-type tyrosine-protein phosphatase F
MVKPDLYGVENEELILVILPQASEEYGPISHYFLIVVPDDKISNNKYPDAFLTDEVCINPTIIIGFYYYKNPNDFSLNS